MTLTEKRKISIDAFLFKYHAVKFHAFSLKKSFKIALVNFALISGHLRTASRRGNLFLDIEVRITIVTNGAQNMKLLAVLYEKN